MTQVANPTVIIDTLCIVEAICKLRKVKMQRWRLDEARGERNESDYKCVDDKHHNFPQQWKFIHAIGLQINQNKTARRRV